LRRTVTLLLVALGAVLLLASPARGAAETFSDNQRVPLEFFDVFVPCAAGGAGEVVSLEGTLHIASHVTLDGAGGFHGTFHANPQGVTGVGQTTGDVYRGTGVSRSGFSGKVGEVLTVVDNFRIIGPGPGNNLLVHGVFHLTVNANGTLTVEVDQLSVECR
jgi:hypothetical protein